MVKFPMTKTAGVKDTATAALLGFLFGGVARSIPSIQTVREEKPALYDAALGAAVVTVLDQIRGSGDERGIMLPGQSPNPVVIPPPGWNLV